LGNFSKALKSGTTVFPGLEKWRNLNAQQRTVNTEHRSSAVEKPVHGRQQQPSMFDGEC
jgi:hypothetical protein